MIHFKMGFIGALLAHEMSGRNLQFTWEDAGPLNYIGNIFPHDEDYDLWKLWLNSKSYLSRFVEFCSPFYFDGEKYQRVTGVSAHLRTADLIQDAKNRFYYQKRNEGLVLGINAAFIRTDVICKVKTHLPLSLRKWEKSGHISLRSSVFNNAYQLKPTDKNSEFILSGPDSAQTLGLECEVVGCSQVTFQNEITCAHCYMVRDEVLDAPSTLDKIFKDFNFGKVV